MVSEYIRHLEAEFQKHSNLEYASWQKKYLKGQFDFFGLKSPLRRELQKPFLQQNYLPSKDELLQITKILWEKPEREFQYFTLDLWYKYQKQIEFSDMELFEYMILTKSWWDTVDGVGPKLVAAYFTKFPEQRDIYAKKWLNSGNMWLQRTTLIFQLFYKENLDTIFLTNTINHLLGSKEFFINKAIGWILRHYSRTNPAWVEEFANNTNLHPLSKREALRLLK